MLTQPGSLKRNRHPISYVLYPGQVRIGESARLGRNDGQHAGYPALGQDRDGHQRPPRVALGLRKIGASPCELVVGGEEGAQVGQIRFGICGGRCCSDGAMFGSGSYPQLAVLVSDQRIHGISRHLRTGQLYRMTEQFVVSALEQVRAAFACPRARRVPRARSTFGRPAAVRASPTAGAAAGALSGRAPNPSRNQTTLAVGA